MDRISFIPEKQVIHFPEGEMSTILRRAFPQFGGECAHNVKEI